MCEAREQQGYGNYGGEITQGILSSPNPSYMSTVFTFCSLREPDLIQALALSVSHGLAIFLRLYLSGRCVRHARPACYDRQYTMAPLVTNVGPFIRRILYDM